MTAQIAQLKSTMNTKHTVSLLRNVLNESLQNAKKNSSYL